jgi:homoserine kinase type II
MAVYTRLSPQALTRYARRFGLGEIRRARGVPAGTINTLYDLRTTRGRFFLRVLEDRSARAAAFEQALLVHLASRGLCVPEMIAAGRQYILSHSERQHVSVFRYLPGRELAPSDVGTGHARQIGAFLAAMHRATRGFRRRHAHDFAPVKMERRLRRCLLSIPRPSVRRHLTVLEQELAQHKWTASLPGGVVHGDLFCDNARFARGKLCGVLDFEMAGNGPLIYDVAVALCAWAFVNPRSLSTPTARALVDGYQSLRRVDAEERHALYEQCRYAAARFALSRYFDFEYTRRPGADRKYKDYREYIDRLRVLRRMGARRFSSLLFADG